VFFRGREIVHKDRGQTMLDRVVQDVADIAKLEQPSLAEGRTLVMMLTPVKK
jgi:bacterial translation initiation factor 3 (bIF-3)